MKTRGVPFGNLNHCSLWIYSLKSEQRTRRCDIIAEADKPLTYNSGERCTNCAARNLKLEQRQRSIRTARRSFDTLEIRRRSSVLLSQAPDTRELLLRQIPVSIRTLSLCSQHCVVDLEESCTLADVLPFMKQQAGDSSLFVRAKLNGLNRFDSSGRSHCIDNRTNSRSVHIDWHRRHGSRRARSGWSTSSCFLIVGFSAAANGEPRDKKYCDDRSGGQNNFTLRYPPWLGSKPGTRHVFLSERS
jgi:hypothetical protein